MDFHVVSSRLSTQKCYISTGKFLSLKLRIGSVARVSTNDGNFLCKVFPKMELQDSTAIVENTVESWDYRTNNVLRKLNVVTNLLKPLVPQVAGKVTVTLVTGSFVGASRLDGRRASRFARDLLTNRVFGSYSCVSSAGVPPSDITSILVLDAVPNDEALILSSETEIVVESVISKQWFERQQIVSEVVLARPKHTYDQLKECVVLSLKYPRTFSRFRTSRGILLHGPSGSGKTETVKYLCSEFDFCLVPVTPADLSSPRPGENEEKLKAVFREAEANCRKNPVVILLDEIDAWCPRRNGKSRENRLVACLINILDDLDGQLPLVVIAATSRIESLEASLRRPGRFDREIYFHTPDAEEREEILSVHCRKLNAKVSCDLGAVAQLTPGYLGADLSLLCYEALMLANDRECVTFDNFKQCCLRVRPSVMRQGRGASDFRKVTWDRIGGLDEARKYIQRSIEWPLKHPEAFVRLNVPQPKGVLIYGPPGCGKSLLVRAAATTCAANFLSVSAAELFSPYVGDSEKMVSRMFQQARRAVPCIIFLDEVDAMIGARSESKSTGRTAQLGVISTLLQEMDGVSSSRGIVVVGATNRPDKIDNALLRPGRFDSIVYIPDPDVESRVAILKALSGKMPVEGVDFEAIALKTPYFSGADLESLCKEAGIAALEESVSSERIRPEHFIRALERVRPSLSAQQLKWYRNYSIGRVTE